MSPTSRGAVDRHKHSLESNIIYASMAVQAILTFTVVGFCAYQLNKCPTGGEQLTTDSTGSADAATCPRALYTNIITGSVAAWFPSPWSALVQVANSSVPDERSPTGRAGDPKPPTKRRRSEGASKDTEAKL
jgi:hypothetical protein